MVISPRFSVRTPSHTSTHGRRNGACLDEGSACSEEESGAGEGNRTLVVSLGSFLSTIEIHPLCGRHCARGQKRRQAGSQRIGNINRYSIVVEPEMLARYGAYFSAKDPSKP